MSIRRKHVVLAGLLALLATESYAQQGSRRIGIGAAIGNAQEIFQAGAISTAGDSVAGAPAILIPIQITNRLRIEPEIGVFRHSREEPGAIDVDYSVSTFEIGLGVFPQTLQQNFRLYYGLRVGYVAMEEEAKQTTSVRGTEVTATATQDADGFFLAPAVGGEYLFSDRFSLGGEVQFRHISVEGDVVFTLPGGLLPGVSPQRFERSVSGTRVLFVSRFYF